MMRMRTALLAWLAVAILAGCASNRQDALLNTGNRTADDPTRLVIVAVDNDDTSSPPRPASTRPGYVRLAYSTGPQARATMQALAEEFELIEVAAWPIGVLRMHCAVLRIPSDSSREQLLERLAQHPRVRLAQPMNDFAPSGIVFNDPYAPLQTAFQSIDAAGAQQWSRGEKVRVAVVDTGLDERHPDFGGRVVVTRNFVDDDGARFQRDVHGTAVAGVISAAANNRVGIVGIAPGVEVIALKACWEAKEPGGGARCNSLTLAQALAAAIEERARIVNLSLTGPRDPLLGALVAAGNARGIIYIGAAPDDAPADSFPAGVPGVIAVQMAESTARRAGVLRAPGFEVVTLAPGGSYDFVSGASLATAHVSGAVALLLAKRRNLERDAIYRLLEHSGRQINACVALAELTPGQTASCNPH